MISEFFLNVIFSIVSGILSMLPDITINVDDSAIEYFFNILRVVCYFLPMGTVIAMVTLIIALSVFRVVIAVIRTIWDLLPLV